MDTLYLVVPCYNEEEVLPETSRRLKEKLEGMVLEGLVDEKSRILFVDDGSRDKTWEIISRLHQEDPRFLGLKLSRNKGHQNALLAGLMTAKELCDMAISLDADLQDDVDAIDRFVLEYQNGCDIVYGVRSKRETDTWFKRTTAEGFYKVMQALGVDIVDNHADYRLMSRRALEGLAQFREVNLFLRGIVPLIGYKSAVVTYERSERFAGESKYPLKKMLSFAFDGITSFSVKPISFILGLGVLMTGISGLALLVLLVLWLLGWGVSGFGVLCGSLWLLGGIQLMALGMVGEYVGKIYKEVKARPKYIIETFLKDQEERG
ncbi:glycosyltransferase family 2 protein [Merdimmobilis hominis]|uniref:Putative glycosyltransferase YkoT n=1 Tax=uncultured Anaerotruncus sp. TaxID=905011 RepID=A0A6N2UEC2_9FIRM|nr:glycosyltransferase family 2 protein [Merdimmobilis hominis]MCD4835405.1 glycosyltransferase family 2 protein [Merdimmobilis hominis]PWL60921.1 MAG: glycosyltransferase [Oscillospiraceae bacterium]